MGVLFKDAEAIEVLQAVDTLVVDKTGTLTEGKPKLVTIEAALGEPSALLHAAASLERGSEHPLAAAIVAGAAERNLRTSPVDGFANHPGKGVSGRVEGERVALV